MSAIAICAGVVREMRRHAARLTLCGAEVLLLTLLELLKPWPLKIVIDNVLGAAPVRLGAHGLPRPMLLPAACLALVALYLALALLQLVNNRLSISIGQRMVADLRGRLFDHLGRLSPRFHHGRELSDLMVRLAYDTYSIQAIAMNALFPMVSSMLLLAGMFAAMVRIDSSLTAAATAVVPLLTVAILALSPHLDRLAGAARMKESDVYAAAHRALSAIELVQAFTCQPQMRRDFVTRSDASLKQNLRLHTLQTAYGGAINVAIAIGTAAVMYLGARHVIEGRLSVGQLVVFVTYLVSLYLPLSQLFQTYGTVQGTAAGMRRCLELLAAKPEIADRLGALALGRVRGAIALRDVSFSYGGAAVLRSVSFTAAPGQSVAIVGPSGAGKTTLLGLLARFYEPNTGTIEIDGCPLNRVTVDSWRRNLAIVPQATLLLADSLRANLALGKPSATAGEMARVARAAQIEPLVACLPRGLDESIGPGGWQLSQGEAQRVAIARALLKDAPILIMDEPTSALDLPTEAALIQALRAAARGRTIIVIAHRLSAIRWVDQIVVLRDGRIQERGGFNELVARGGFFSYLYSLQGGADAATA